MWAVWVLLVCSLGLLDTGPSPAQAFNVFIPIDIKECIPDSSSAFRTRADCRCGNFTGRGCGSGRGKELICTRLKEFFVENRTFPSVHCLIITHSEFTELGTPEIMQFPNLTGLIINDSRLEEVKPNSLNKLHSLELLTLRNDRLTSVPRMNHRYLQILDLGRNLITKVDDTTFRHLPNLDILEMDANRIEELRGRIFSDNCDLALVRFSDNPLRKIDEEVFDGAMVNRLYLSRTKVSEIPRSEILRSRLQELTLDGTTTFQTFKALSTSDDYFNTTYPLLERVQFPYHAHCCQLKELGVKYYKIGAPGPPPTLENRALAMTTPTPGVGVVCVNRTSMECVSDDLTGNSHAVDAAEFCSIPGVCGSCADVQDVCGGECATPTTPQGAGSGEGNDIMPATPDILCLDQIIQPSPTVAPTPVPVPESSISLSLGGTATTIVMVEQTLCATTSCVATPTATPIATPTPGAPQCTSVRTVEAECVGMTERPGTVPPPPSPCDHNYCDIVHPDNFLCTICDFFSCAEPDDCNDLFAAECPIWTARSTFCTGRRKKRSAPSSEGSKLLPLPLDYATETEGKRQKRQALPVCSENELEPFQANIENFTGPVTCTLMVPPPFTQAPQRSICPSIPAPLLSSLFVEVGPAICTPPESAFNPCQDLLGESDSLRGAIWVVVVLAFIGNGLVFIVFIGYSVIVRRTKQDLFVVHFLYSNLAMADFLMGVYLFVIAVQDARTRGSFYITDISWRLGHACEFAGFCAMTSTVVSVYILMVITVERTYTITQVLNRKKLTKKHAIVVVLIGWGIGIFIASLPLFYFNDYNSVAICLPFNVEEPQGLAYVVILLFGTGIAFAVIAICYALILQQILCSRRKSSPYIESKRRLTGEVKVAIRIFVLVSTNFVSWFPIALVGLTAAFGVSIVDDLEFARWAIVFIFPINACLNPMLYSLTTRAFRDNFVLLFNQCGLFKERSQNIRNAQVGIPSYTSKTSNSGLTRMRNTVVTRLRSFSLSSQSSTMDLFGRNRRLSTMSQTSEESTHIAMLNARRRNSAMSNDSAREMLGRSRSDSTFSGDSEEAITILNAGFRTSSPEGVNSVVKVPVAMHGNDLRARVKVSASSLEALPELEEVEVPIEDEHMVKVNPGAFCKEEDNEKTKWEGEEGGNQRDSGVVEGSENDSGEVDMEVIVTPPPQTYQLKTKEEGPDEES